MSGNDHRGPLTLGAVASYGCCDRKAVPVSKAGVEAPGHRPPATSQRDWEQLVASPAG